MEKLTGYFKSGYGLVGISDWKKDRSIDQGLYFLSILKLAFQKKGPNNNSRGSSHTLTACCSDPDSAGTEQSEDEVGNRWRNTVWRLMSRYKQTHLISRCLWWWCCSCWCDCWRPDRNMDRSGPHWHWTAATVDLWCSRARLWRPTGAEQEDWTELNRAWSDWIQLKRKCCYFHSLLGPWCLDHLRKEKRSGNQHFRALMVKLDWIIVHGGEEK